MGANLVQKGWTQCQYFWMVYEKESGANTLTVSEHEEPVSLESNIPPLNLGFHTL